MDWPHAIERYFEWTDAMGRRGGYVDIPRFTDQVNQITYQEAIDRRKRMDGDKA